MEKEPVKKIVVIGTGIMGCGIAQVCAQAGYKTSITRKRIQLLQKAINEIKSNLQLLMENDVITKDEADDTLLNIDYKKSLTEVAKDADFVIEAVVENIELKKNIFKGLDTICPKHTIFATNTSSFSITDIASATNRQDKVVGMHWWNPPYLMPLVEIIKGEQTSSETINMIKELITRLGKVPVLCKDSPGFLGVRLQAALVIEAISILEERVASVEDVDMAVKMSLGFRVPILGPLETVDLGGMDTFFYAYNYLHKMLGERFRPPELLRHKMDKGDLGIKTGRGFYDYEGKSVESIKRQRDEWIITQLKRRGLVKSRKNHNV